MKTEWLSGKGMNAGCGGAVIKHFPTLSHSRVFGKPFPRFPPLRILRRGLMGRSLGFRVTAAHVAHLSPPLVITRRIVTDFSAIY